MSAAVFYNPEGFDTSGPKLMGRHAAGEGFLRGWFRHASAPEKYCFAASPHAFEVFKTRAAALGGDPAQCSFIPFQNPKGLGKPGTLYLPDPNLGHFAWRRRWLDPKAYSLSGVTHTLASEGVMDQIGALLTAPVEPWDALVCTSKAGKNAVLRVLSEWRDYQTARFLTTPGIRRNRGR